MIRGFFRVFRVFRLSVIALGASAEVVAKMEALADV